MFSKAMARELPIRLEEQHNLRLSC